MFSSVGLFLSHSSMKNFWLDRILPPRDGHIRSPLYWIQPKERHKHPTDRSYSLRAKAKDIDAAELQ